MLATICGLLVFSFINFFLFYACIAGIAALGSGESVTKSKPHSVYMVDMSGVVVERSNSDQFTSAFMEMAGREQADEYGLNDIIKNIRKAKEDKNIEGICLRGGSLSMGMATAQTIRRELLDFKESGKFIIAYADNYGQLNYYLASCADKIMLNPIGAIDLHGLAIDIEFFKRLLDNVGVEMQVVKVGTFKSATEPYILTSMSDANRLQYQVLLDEIWHRLCTDISKSRDISPEQLNELADRYMGLQPTEECLTAGLVDTLCYKEGIDSLLAQLCGTKDFKKLSYSDMLTLQVAKEKYSKEKIAVLYADGDITDEKGDGIVGKEIIKTISELTNKESVKAVVLRVNSPGGSAYASEQIHHALSLCKGKKPLVVSMGDYAASGGYYISCPANYIFAENNTLTGSIGIFGVIPNMSGLTDKVGIDNDGVQTNRHGLFESNAVLKGMNAEERAMLQAEINRGYELFTSRCAEGRCISQDSIKAVGEGRVWTGIHALQLGLVDELGSLDDAIKKAAQLAGIDKYEIIEYPKLDDELTRLMKALGMDDAADRIVSKIIGQEKYNILKVVETLSAKPSVQAMAPLEIQSISKLQ